MPRKTNKDSKVQNAKKAVTNARKEAQKVKEQDRARTIKKELKPKPKGNYTQGRINKRTGKPARDKTQNDTLYNIKRRYRRAAERNERYALEAEVLGNEQAAKEFRATARAARIIAGGFTAKSINALGKTKEERLEAAAKLIEREEPRSLMQLERNVRRNPQQRRDAIAETIMAAGSASVVYAATKTLWQDVPADKRNEAIIQGFKDMGFTQVNDLLDVLNVLEDMGVQVLSPQAANDREAYIMRSRMGMLAIARAQAA